MSDQFLFAIMIFVGLGILWIYGAHLDNVAEEAEKLKAKKEQEELNNEEVEEIERVNND